MFSLLKMGLTLPTGQATPNGQTPRTEKTESTPRIVTDELQMRETKPDFKDRARKRQSRLGTSKYLAPKKEISPSEKLLVLKQGFVRWSSPCKRPFGGKV
jgi:hypothetical protein